MKKSLQILWISFLVPIGVFGGVFFLVWARSVYIAYRDHPQRPENRAAIERMNRQIDAMRQEVIRQEEGARKLREGPPVVGRDGWTQELDDKVKAMIRNHRNSEKR